MADLILSGSTSGTITVSAPAVSGSSVLTLPVATDTLVGKATTDTLTNKTLTGAVFTAMPATTTAQSMVRLVSGNGFGSSSTAIRRFTTTITNQGSDITYADSATLGATFTINTNGVYAISYGDAFTATSSMGISLNSTQLTTAIDSITAADRLTFTVNTTAGYILAVSNTLYLASGSVIRAHVAAALTGTSTPYFTITRVA